MSTLRQKLKSVYLVIAACGLLFVGAVAGLLGGTYLAKADTTTPVASTASTREELWNLTNEYRAEAGENPLSLDPTLNDTAQAKCDDMVAKNEFEHGGLQATADRLGRQMGENLAEGYGSPSEIVKAWADSPTHYENLIRHEFSRVGFGLCESTTYGSVVVQHFSN